MGWFWGPQRDFDRIGLEEGGGILDTVVGYTGSHDTSATNPTYKNIQDFAEAIRITFDDSKMTYHDILNLFFSFHTPEDPDFSGTQYRSCIFYHTEDQRVEAENVVESWGAFGKHVAVEKAGDFYRAEEYHQKYMEKF